MTTPQRPYDLTVVGGVYRFHWHAAQVHITVERIKETTRQAPTAEVRISAYPEGHLHLTTLNLLATRSRNEVARYCADRGNMLERDWSAIIEEMCVAVLDRWRQGEPVVRLGEVNPTAEPPWRLEPILMDSEACLIYGEGGIGKSYVAALCGVLVDQGMTFGRLRPIRGRVLYLDYETGRDVTARRINALQAGFGVDEPSNILYRFCWQPVAAEVPELQRIVAENDIQLVIIDSAGPACGGEPEAASSAISYFTALRSLHATSLTIAHRSKGAGSIGPFGSVYWVNYPRSTYELKKSQTEGENIIHVALMHRKANEGRLQSSVSYKFEFNGNSVRVGMETLEDVPDFFDDMPLAERMVTTLRTQGATTVRELAETLGANQRSIQVMLSRDAQFVRAGNNTWEIHG